MADAGDGLAPIAHSARRDGEDGDPYARHVTAVRHGTLERADAMVRYCTNLSPDLLITLDAAAAFHDLGKLDPDIQAVFRRVRKGRLRWDHIDAGVAHLRATGNPMAAWLVRAHHAPGFPRKANHFDRDGLGRCLRGRRNDDLDRSRHDEQIARTDKLLGEYIAEHERAIGCFTGRTKTGSHGLSLRLALSCLVDADHSDTALYDTGIRPPASEAPKWGERLDALCRYVRALPQGDCAAERIRNQRRSKFFDACRNAGIKGPMVACQAPVGIGKTTAVAAYLIRRASEENLRRLIIIAPYTNILTQTARRLREALVLPGELPEEVIVEHHHRADFNARNNRHLAVLWQAPIVLTTAVSFFETLAACDPASLRKLHAVPGSAIFLDEAHAALPTKLWPQNWLWLRELAEQWGCRFVFVSGSLARFWENKDVIPDPVRLPELLPVNQAQVLSVAERHRVRYARLRDGLVLTIEELISEISKAAGPRLVILNTVQNAAIVAASMRDAGLKVLHLSTALTPRDRDRVVARIIRQLSRPSFHDWTLVATSCVEAGVDFSFRSAFRERFATASTLQIAGRVNRHGEYDSVGGSIVFDFALQDIGITQHPEASISAEVLRELLLCDALNRRIPSDLVTEAMREELLRRGGLENDLLLKAEQSRDYPAVKKYGRVIDVDTRLVIVDPRLKTRLRRRKPVSYRQLLSGSVQLWLDKIEKLGLEAAEARSGRQELYFWNDFYDPNFLGIMAGLLRTERSLEAGIAII
jgi:CRISPR-associated endonuclease/helicase Cas3